MSADLSKYAIIIPSLDPDEKLNKTIDGMLAAGFSNVVLVNDGSSDAHLEPFRKACEHPECKLLVHDINKGKGAGLKTAFSYVDKYMPEITAVITMDGDGQHTPKDAIKIAEAMDKNHDMVVMGCRDFDMPNVPTHNMLGNRITSTVFRLFLGIKLSDTQTGFRGIPKGYLRDFCTIKSNRFEYETDMLIMMRDKGIKFQEVPIETVYLEENKSSHFNPFKDSIRIYKIIFKNSMILRQLVSSIICTLIDLTLFTILRKIIANKGIESIILITLLATAPARICSALLNFGLNKRYVFRSKETTIKETLPKYAILAVCQMTASWLILSLFTKVLMLEGFVVTICKAIVDVTIFLLSYLIQKKYIFK